MKILHIQENKSRLSSSNFHNPVRHTQEFGRTQPKHYRLYRLRLRLVHIAPWITCYGQASREKLDAREIRENQNMSVVSTKNQTSYATDKAA